MLSAPEMTVEALMYSLRSRGLGAMDEAQTKRRLEMLSLEQRAELVRRLTLMQGEYPAITGSLLAILSAVPKAGDFGY